MADTFYLPPDDPDMDKPYIKGSEYMNGLRTGVKTISSRMDTELVFAGDGAKTDGKTVYLPAQDPEAMMTHREVAIGRGFGNHEALHQILTDMDAWFKWAEEREAQGMTWTRHMGNAIEDVRIEHGGLTLYPGIAKSIDKTAEAVVRKAAQQLTEKPELRSDMLAVLPLATTWAGRIRLGYPSEALQSAFDQLDPAIQDRANKIVDAIMGLETGVRGVGDVVQYKAYAGSRAALDLADLVTKEIAEETKPPIEDGRGDDRGDDGEGEGDDERTEEGDAPDGDDGDGEKREVGGGTDFDGDRDPYEHLKGAETVDSELDQVREDMGKADDDDMVIAHPWSTSWDEAFDCIDDNVLRAYNTEDMDTFASNYAKRRAKLGSRLATMRRKLEAALVTKTRSEWTPARTGRLDVRRRGVGIMRGDDKIFRRLEEADAIDTAVQLLIDCSGSMSGSKMRMAGDVSIALSIALDGAGIPFECIGFWSDYPYEDAAWGEAWEQTRDARGYARYDTLRVPVFKGFEHALRQRFPHMGSIEDYARSDNPDADALRFVLPRLLARPESRKVMMVLSDGSPCYATGWSYSQVNADTRRAVAEVANAGVDIVGIGILDSSVKSFYPNHVVVHDLDDLSKTVLDRLAKLLLGDRFHVDVSDVA